MEEAATNEKRNIDLPNDVKLPQNSTQDKVDDNEEKNNDDKVDERATASVSVAEGNETQESVDSVVGNSVDNADSVNQLGHQPVSGTVSIDKEVTDEEKEKSEQLNNDDNKDIPHADAGDIPDDSHALQIEDTVETSDVNSEKMEQEDKSDTDKQPDKEANVESVVSSDDLAEAASAEVPKLDSDDSKIGIPSEKIEEASNGVSPPLAQVADDESPEDSDKAEVTSTENQPLEQIGGKDSPEGDGEKNEVSTEGTEIKIPETQPSAQVITTTDKESAKEKGLENATMAEEQPPVAHPEEESRVSTETSEVAETAETKPEATGDDKTGGEEKAAEGSPSQTTWYTDNEGNQKEEAEGYSTTVVGGVVMRKAIPSTSNEPKKPAKGPTTGSVFKKMSLGSIFGRKKSVKDKPDMTQQPATDTPVHDGTDGVQEPNDTGEKGNSTPVETTAKEESQAPQETGEATTAEKPQENEPEKPAKKEENEDTVEGAIVPLEEGVVDEEEKTTKMVDDVPDKEEQQNDVESPTDEDSVLRERIAKRESASPPHSPTKHMHMRMSYAEGTKEVEVIGTCEAPLQHKQDKHKTSRDNRLSCRELGEVDHEGWLTKRGGGAIFASWKRKWVVLKEQHVYYYKTSFDPEAGGVMDVKDHSIAAVPEMKKKFCFKIESKDPKAAKLYFAADSQEDMDKWISVLTCASRGEVIVHKTQNQQSAEDVRMRKKTNSLGKRAGSVLGLGGYYNYDGELEKTDQKRRASFGSSPKEAAKNMKPGDNTENKERSESPIENATPSDIQKLMTTQTEGDSVDAPVAMETSPTAPLQEAGSTEVKDTVASATASEEQKPSNIDTDVKISSSEETKEQCSPEVAPLEETMTTPVLSQSETKEASQEQKNPRVATPSEQPTKPSQPTLPSNTTWYYVLDDGNEDWIDLDEQKAMDANRESDELLSLVRTIKDARLSIIGTPLPGNEERARAMTSVSKQNEEVLKLREMRRTLKDKQRDLMAMEELLSAKEVNRQSIHEWKTRYSYLTPGEDSMNEDEPTDKKGEKNEFIGAEMQGGEVDGTDGKVGEKKVDDGADAQEVKSEESGNEENGLPEHGGEVPSGGEDQDTELNDGNEAQKVEESGDGANPQVEKSDDVQNGEDQDTKPRADDQAQTEAESKDRDPGYGGEGEDKNGVNVDVPTNANDVTNDTSLAKEGVDGEEADEVTKHVGDEAGESLNQDVQEETTEPNNNGGATDKPREQSEEEPQNNDEEKQASETLPQQDQDSIDTRL